MKQVIARIKLNPGQGGFFDPVTRIHLTHGDPVQDVYAGMNTEGLKAAVRNKRISLVSGSLGSSVAPFKFVRRQDGKIVIVPNAVQQSENVQQNNVTKKTNKTNSVPKKTKPTIVEQPKDTLSAVPAVEETPVVQEAVQSEQPVVQETIAPVETAEPVIVPQEETTNNDTVVESQIDITVRSDSDIPVSDIIEDQEESMVTDNNDNTNNVPFRRNKKNKRKYNDN